MRTCVAGVCGASFTAANTSLAAQTAGDCTRGVCDGNGTTAMVVDDSDVPADDGNLCTGEVCSAGTPGHPATMACPAVCSGALALSSASAPSVGNTPDAVAAADRNRPVSAIVTALSPPTIPP